MANREARRRAWRFGRRAEAAALWLLRLKGYRILARNVRLPVGELDVVARRGRLVAFIEVKARPDIGQAAAALSTRQRQRIRRAAGVGITEDLVLGGICGGVPAERDLIGKAVV
ncbi:MAG: YraN family protein [Pseudomonadota bacterium]